MMSNKVSGVARCSRKYDRVCKTLTLAAWCYLLAAALSACGTSNENPAGGASANSMAAPAQSVAKAPADLPGGDSQERLRELLNERVNTKSDSDYALGPGDVLDVSVQDVPELHGCRVRISGDNTLSLPILGEINVAGLNEEGVKERIYDRASRYVHDPEVEVFVRDYHSRDVMVMGMVQKPGMYALDSPSETVLDVIGKAGGSTERAANQIILIPAGAENNASGEAAEQPTKNSFNAAGEGTPQQNAYGKVAAAGPVQPISASTIDQSSSQAHLTAGRSQAIVLDTSGSGDPALLMLPARPGDLIMIPAAGEVMVQGWVRNPGAFVITPRMTALGAVTAAGGEMFTSSADLLRGGNDTDQTDYHLHLDKIKSREEEDVLVQSGDVIIVNKSAAGAVPFFVYSLFNKLSSGVYATPF